MNLTASDTMAAVKLTSNSGGISGRIHDALHVVAAEFLRAVCHLPEGVGFAVAEIERPTAARPPASPGPRGDRPNTKHPTSRITLGERALRSIL